MNQKILKTNNMLKNALLIFLTFFFFSAINAQEKIYDLGGNKHLRALYNKSIAEKNPEIFRKPSKKNKILLSLPFMDDFSQNYHFSDDDVLWR